MAATSQDVSTSLHAVLSRVQQASDRSKRSNIPRLVGVSKTKPVELLKEAYSAGLRTFGENYVQEIVEKAPQLPDDIQWHFIGHLQSNKAKKLLEGVPNLKMIETVHSVQLATKMNSVLETLEREPLDTLVQVNTSGEDTKSGVEPKDAIDLARFIHEECPKLRFAGFMTIGMPDFTSRPEDFTTLMRCREEASQALGLNPDDLEVSMGMSNDFEQAVRASTSAQETNVLTMRVCCQIEMGSTNVRVGSAIFGARSYSK